MISAFEAFNNLRLNKESKHKLDGTVKNFSYHYVASKLNLDSKIILNLANSSMIMINHYEDLSIKNDELHFIIVFRETVLIVKKSNLKNLKQLFQMKNELKICFFEDTESIFDENINYDDKLKYDEIKKNEFFSDDISAISKEFFNYEQFKYKEFLKNIKLCISGYLLQQSYCDLNYDRIKDFYTKSKEEIIPRKMNENELIELRTIGTGSLFKTDLYYHISDEKLCIIKVPINTDPEIKKLLEREQKNYTKIKHSNIPKYYGTTDVENKSCIVIEYINGQLLSAIDYSQFSVSEKIRIIVQLLSVVKYLHENNFIYRDMKPNNVIIDQNKTLVVIDFDRMIEDNCVYKENDDPRTIDFNSIFCAPEIESKNTTNKCDIYSVGKMINRIIPDMENDSILKKCTNKTPANRPSASNLYYLFFIFIEDKKISVDIFPDFNHNNPDVQYNLGLIYSEGKYISRDINKAIYYYSLAANQNIPQAQFNLGVIYYEGKYIPQDINKAIYYYSLASNQNYPKAQYNLGLIYYEDQYIPRDINKSIYYYSLAANQNYPKAQYNLGLIYYEDQYIPQDINKSIYYYSLAANQNIPQAQYNLGIIYYEDQYIPRDINKAIYYYSLAANQNDPDAQFYLGLIYYEDQYIPRDINKAIYYFSLAANQNYPKAQYNLGLIYYEDQYILRDINKSIYYYSLAANQNDPEAQYNLGLIYYEDQYILRDINKSIYYFSLAANQNHPEAQFYLGLIYYEGEYMPRDINKAIYYFSLAANKNDPKLQFNLGVIYYKGEYIPQDINKAIYYFSLAANQNYPEAQYNLGVIYYKGLFIKQDIKRGNFWISKSSNNDCIKAHFTLGFLYQEGKYMKRNIDESIKYYKKASSFNNQYAKNNLGIIYKNYFEKKYDYKVYFEEAIRQKNDPVSMYNLAHSYIYEYQDDKLINKSIELLIKSSKLEIFLSTKLLCIILLKTFFDKQTNNNEPINISDIEQELSKFNEETNELKYSIISIIQLLQLYDQSIFKSYYKKYEEIELVYDLFLNPVCIKDLYKEKNELKLEEYNITTDFYEGFGLDI